MIRGIFVIIRDFNRLIHTYLYKIYSNNKFLTRPAGFITNKYTSELKFDQ